MESVYQVVWYPAVYHTASLINITTTHPRIESNGVNDPICNFAAIFLTLNGPCTSQQHPATPCRHPAAVWCRARQRLAHSNLMRMHLCACSCTRACQQPLNSCWTGLCVWHKGLTRVLVSQSFILPALTSGNAATPSISAAPCVP